MCDAEVHTYCYVQNKIFQSFIAGNNNLNADGFLTPPDYVYHHYEDLQKQMTYYAQKHSVIHILYL